VLRAEPGKKRDEMLKAWAEEVWKSWKHYHDWVRMFCHQWLHRWSLFAFTALAAVCLAFSCNYEIEEIEKGCHSCQWDGILIFLDRDYRGQNMG
jgi:hypothetical protein